MTGDLPEDRTPRRQRDHEGDGNGRRAEILDDLDGGIDLRLNSVGELFDGGVEKFDHQEKKQRRNRGDHSGRRIGYEEGDRRRQRDEQDFGADGPLATDCMNEPVPRVHAGAEEAGGFVHA